MATIEFIRQYKIFGYAIFDLSVSFLGIILLSPFLTKIFQKVGLNIPLVSWLLFTLPLSIVVHLLVGTKTQMVKDFLNPDGHYFIKVIIIGFFVCGLLNVKKVLSD